MKQVLRAGLAGFLVLFVVGCASTPSGPTPEGGASGQAGPREAESPAATERPRPAVMGSVEVDVTDVEGRNLPSRLELRSVDGEDRRFFEIPNGVKTVEAGVGDYYAFVYVYDGGIPVMVHAQELTVSRESAPIIPVTLLEGASGKLTVHDFDQDNDLAIDKVELVAGTDPLDSRSIPGRKPVIFDDRVLHDEERWYRGELHAISSYGGGRETVAELVRRAENAGLDFLAITDLNTMAACSDPAFQSDSVVLIPAMAWGNREMGIGLVYGPATIPDPPTTREAAQAECVRIQSQGGVFAIAHPCAPEAPWLWGLSHVNAVQVWNGPWREPAPLHLKDLSEDVKIRERGSGELVRSIAAAAAVAEKTARAAATARRENLGVSANDQASIFWDYELTRGSVSSPIAGGAVDGPDVPMGKPATWVKAPNKSVAGILHGLRMGRTFVNAGIGEAEISFSADALSDNTIDVGVGGAVPLGIEVTFHVTVYRADGAKVQLYRDGHPILTKVVETDRYTFAYPHKTDFPSVYRVRVIDQPRNPGSGYGPVEVLAMSSPIYAADIGTELLMTGPVDMNKTWIRLDSKYTPDDPRIQRY